MKEPLRELSGDTLHEMRRFRRLLLGLRLWSWLRPSDRQALLWLAFAAGITFAFGFVLWLIGQSIYILGTLCQWCMVTWLVTIPTFYAVWVHLLRAGAISDSARVRAVGAKLGPWVPLLAILTYAIVLLLAQLRLDAIPQLIDVIF